MPSYYHSCKALYIFQSLKFKLTINANKISSLHTPISVDLNVPHAINLEDKTRPMTLPAQQFTIRLHSLLYMIIHFKCDPFVIYIRKIYTTNKNEIISNRFIHSFAGLRMYMLNRSLD